MIGRIFSLLLLKRGNRSFIVGSFSAFNFAQRNVVGNEGKLQTVLDPDLERRKIKWESTLKERRFSESRDMFYSNRKSGDGYCRFKHRLHDRRLFYVHPHFRRLFKLWLSLLAVGNVVLFGMYGYFQVILEAVSDAFISEAKCRDITEEAEYTENSNGHRQYDIKKPNRVTFRQRRIIQYENRVRAYSTPDKTFRYFATLKVYAQGQPPHGHNYAVFMTPEDFVRSLTPNTIQPEGLGLDQFRIFDPVKEELQCCVDRDSIFFTLGENGLISFSDYLFLLTILSTSPRHFSLAFRIFDKNSDGRLDMVEFEQLQDLILMQTMIGQRHRDHTTGSCLKHGVNSALGTYFFGKDKKDKLTIDKFLAFQEHLQRDILWIEFQRRDPVSDPSVKGRITEWAFANMLLQHSGLSDRRQKRMLKRVKNFYKHQKNRPGISFEEVEGFFKLLYQMSDVEMALSFYHVLGASIDATTLRRVVKNVTGRLLPEHVIDVVVILFDENGDGQLSHREFVAVMKRRLMRGLERPKDTGFLRLLAAVYNCTLSSTPFN